MHLRAAIRQTVIDILSEFVPTVEGRVFKARVYPMDDQALPGLCVFINDETGQLGTTAGLPRSSERVLALSVQIFVKAAPDITDALAEISAQIENALGQFNSLGGLVLDVFLSGYEESLNANQGDRAQAKKSGVGDLTFQILYDVPENQVEVEPSPGEVIENGDFSGGFDGDNIPEGNLLSGAITEDRFLLSDEINSRFGINLGSSPMMGIYQTGTYGNGLYKYSINVESMNTGNARIRFDSNDSVTFLFNRSGIITGYVTLNGLTNIYLEKTDPGVIWFNSWSLEKILETE